MDHLQSTGSTTPTSSHAKRTKLWWPSRHHAPTHACPSHERSMYSQLQRGSNALAGHVQIGRVTPNCNELDLPPIYSRLMCKQSNLRFITILIRLYPLKTMPNPHNFPTPAQGNISPRESNPSCMATSGFGTDWLLSAITPDVQWTTTGLAHGRSTS